MSTDENFDDIEYEYEDSFSDEESEENVEREDENGDIDISYLSTAKSSSAIAIKSQSKTFNLSIIAKTGVSSHILDFKSVHDIMQSFISEVSTLLEIDKNVSQFVLQLNDWNKEKVVESFLCNPSKMLLSVGLTSFDQKNVDKFFLASVNSPQKVARILDESINSTLFSCKICFDEFSSIEKDGFSLGCGHLFCKDCFGSYLKGQVEGGPQCVSAHCPEHKCLQAVTQDVYYAFLDNDNVVRDKYDRYQCTHFVDCSKAMRFCPAANCEKVVMSTDSHSQSVVRCSCSFVFCFDCGEESHAPTSCLQLSSWTEKCMSDGESSKWIFANTKKCPKCHKRIEKNHGCNHMTCTQCRYEFCWICMGDWRNHSNCNRYSSDNASEKTAQEIVRAELDRYLHYYNRYQAHESSLKIANKQRIAALEKMREMQAQQADAWIDVQYVRDAVEEVIECRRVLKYSYVVGFYMEDWCPERRLFEDHQQRLEEHTEKLHECTEGKNVFTADRTQVVNWTRITERFRSAILENFLDGEMLGGEAGASRGETSGLQVVWSSSGKKDKASTSTSSSSSSTAARAMNASLGGEDEDEQGVDDMWGGEDEEDEDLMRAIQASMDGGR
jgi:ariadne-1